MTPAKNLSINGEGTLTALALEAVDDYFNCHHKTFIQQLMEVDAEIHS